MQAGCGPQHLFHHALHALAVRVLHQRSVFVEGTGGLAQGKGARGQPAFQVDEQQRQVAL